MEVDAELRERYEGVAASTRIDAQAKSFGEWLRARVVDVPVALLA